MLNDILKPEKAGNFSFFETLYAVLTESSTTWRQHDRSCAKHPRLQQQDTGQHSYAGYGRDPDWHAEIF
jgi:hypothetical protein